MISRVPVLSKAEQKTPFKDCQSCWTQLCVDVQLRHRGNRVEVCLSDVGREDQWRSPTWWVSRYRLVDISTRSVLLSFNWPPENITPSSFVARVLIIASWPEKLCTNMPSGHFHFLILFESSISATIEAASLHSLIAASTCAGEAVFGGMNSKSSNGFLVMCQGSHTFARCQIP